MIDLSNHTLAELRNLQSQVTEQISVRQKEDISKVREQIESLAGTVGMTVEQIMGTKAARVKKPSKPVAARYQNPENEAEKWSGRGRQPKWVKEFVEAGNPIEKLLVS